MTQRDARSVRDKGLLLVVITTLVLLSACRTRGDRHVKLATSASSATEVPRHEADVEARAVVGVYRDWLLLAHETSVDSVGATANVAALRERLGRVAGPAVVDVWVRTLLDRAVNGIAARRDRRVDLLDVERVSVVGDGASLVGCVRDAGVLYETATGRPVDSKVAFDRVTLGFSRHEQSWKLDRVVAVEEVPECRAR